MADLYVYPNTIVIIKINGANLREWLEMCAGQFNRIDPSVKTEQELINNEFPTYNFDVIDGVNYEIDVSQEARYDRGGKVQNAGAHRIRSLTYKGAQVKDADEFILASNNYRAYGGGNFPGTGAASVVLASPDENRQVILKYLEAVRRIDPKPDGNWKLVLPAWAGPVIFNTSPLAKDAAQSGAEYLRTNEEGYGVFRLLP
jgi:2',3'-cyclic-nucleotide 2'-phosphodiesterase/3'-nucleotidase